MITVVYCTRNENKKHQEHLFKSSGLHKKLEIIEIINKGKFSLTEIYNRGLKQAKNDLVVFCHDDIELPNNWGKKLLKHFSKSDYGIIGVAGTKSLSENGRWWTDPSKMYGRVKHTNEGKSWLSAYSDDLGNKIEEVVLVDGLFFAIDKKRIKLDFDESVEGFHFYDVDFCFRNHLKGVKIGVITDIRVNHFSIGQTNDKWEENRVKFSDKYKNELPVKLNETFENRKMKVLIPHINKEGSLLPVIKLGTELTSLGISIGIVSNFDRLTVSETKKGNIKSFSLQEPPSFKVGDGQFSLNTPNGPILSEVNKLYKVSQSPYDIVFTDDIELIKSYKDMYPECKFVDVNSDEFIEMDKTAENYKELFINTYNG
jgi:glycosyltransferase involved in cell wall biosynthesis